MPKFRVLVHGRGLVLRRFFLWRRRFGFYVTCFVEADGAAGAKQAALDIVRDDPKLILASLQPPTIDVDEVEEVSSFDGNPVSPSGFVLYPEDHRASSPPVA